MISVVSSSNNNSSSSGLESSSDRQNDVVEEKPPVASTSNASGGGDGGPDTNSVGPVEETAAVRVGVDESEGGRASEVSSHVDYEPRVSETKADESRFSGLSTGNVVETKGSPSSDNRNDVRNGTRNDVQNDSLEVKKSSIVADYDSMLSAFDEFATEGRNEGVGYGYEIGDMVWGKVKSHPWWPGHIYNEAFASPSVRRSKREGHVLVAFFGDSSYGWFDPAELIPFEPNFAEKSRQTVSKSFLKAVEEAIDEVSRRRGVGLSCRCRNPYNFRPTTAEGYLAVDVGDYEPGAIYSLSRIKKSRDSFRPREMLGFIRQVALTPTDEDYGKLGFIKDKATVLACRKALFEEFDETYAQAFGAQPVRPPRPTEPVAPDPSKAPLSGRLVIAEPLTKGKSSGRHNTKTRDEVEKERYLFKRRDDNELKPRKTPSVQVGSSSQPFLVDGSGFSGQVVHSGILHHGHQMSLASGSEGSEHSAGHSASAEFPREEKQGGHSGGHLSATTVSKPFAQVSKKVIGSGTKKSKTPKRPAGELSGEISVLAEKKKKRKKELSTGVRTGNLQPPAAAPSIGALVEKVPGALSQDPLDTNYQVSNQNKNDSFDSSAVYPMEMQQTVGIENADQLRTLLRDLQALALNPFHGVERNRPDIILKVFSRFRSLVYQKSLGLLAQSEEESNGARPIKLPSATVPDAPENIKDTQTLRPPKPPVRLEDPTKGGRKRSVPDRQEDILLKKRKKVNDIKQLAAEKRAAQKVPESPRADLKETAAKTVGPTPQRTVKPDPSKRTEQTPKVPNPTMLVMKFPTGAALPSMAELKAKFARFGPLDHSGTRVFWKSSTCRLVYRYKIHAQAAFKFAAGSSTLFGNTNVRCSLRELGVEPPETESFRAPKEDLTAATSQPPESRIAAKVVVQQFQQQPSQLKSCLKKPAGEEGGNGGMGRGGSRVKFMLAGEENSRNEPMIGNKNLNNNNATTTIADAGSSKTVDYVSKNFPKIIPHSSTALSSTSLPMNHQFQILPNNMPPMNEQVQRFSQNVVNVPSAPLQTPTPSTSSNIDIAQPMLSLLMKCNDVINNLTAVLGYSPYHPL